MIIVFDDNNNEFHNRDPVVTFFFSAKLRTSWWFQDSVIYAQGTSFSSPNQSFMPPLLPNDYSLLRFPTKTSMWDDRAFAPFLSNRSTDCPERCTKNTVPKFQCISFSLVFDLSQAKTGLEWGPFTSDFWNRLKPSLIKLNFDRTKSLISEFSFNSCPPCCERIMIGWS